MPYAIAPDGVRLYFEEAGQGTPILFAHEFGGDYRSWEPQMRYFSRLHRCIAYSARGYKPSDVPQSPEAYSHQHWTADAIAVLDHLKIDKAHIVGLSMGGYATLQVGLNHPQRARSLVIAGCGSGSERNYIEEFRQNSRATADVFEQQGSAEAARSYGYAPGRIPFLVKDPRGFAEFIAQFSEHDAKGSAQTLRGFQAGRPSVYDFEAEIRRCTLASLVIVGDEDDVCIEPSLFLKAWLPAGGLSIFPKTGHGVNLEEPDLFNRTVGEFIARVEAGRWTERDPRSRRT